GRDRYAWSPSAVRLRPVAILVAETILPSVLAWHTVRNISSGFRSSKKQDLRLFFINCWYGSLYKFGCRGLPMPSGGTEQTFCRHGQCGHEWRIPGSG